MKKSYLFITISFFFAMPVFLFSCKKDDSSTHPVEQEKAFPGDTIGDISTEVPIVQHRSSNTYNWMDRHEQILKLNKKDPPKNLILGNSITHYWGGKPITPKQIPYRGEDSWDRYFRPVGLRNMGFSYDRIENVLWRVYHGELDGYKADNVLLLIGTNNLSVTDDPDSAIVAGLHFLLNAVMRHQSDAHIILMGLLPRRGYESRVKALDEKIETLANALSVQYLNAGTVLLKDNGQIDESLFVDGLHPNYLGYRKLAPLMSAALK